MRVRNTAADQFPLGGRVILGRAAVDLTPEEAAHPEVQRALDRGVLRRVGTAVAADPEPAVAELPIRLPPAPPPPVAEVVPAPPSPPAAPATATPITEPSDESDDGTEDP